MGPGINVGHVGRALRIIVVVMIMNTSLIPILTEAISNAKKFIFTDL